MPNLFYAGIDAFSAQNLSSGLHTFVADRNPIYSGIARHIDDVQAWLSSPEVWPIILAWWIAFMLVVTIIFGLGFGPAGVVAGSLAAGFQAWMYGAFTPAAGIFATLTSLGMLGLLLPVAAAVAAFIASLVAVGVYFLIHGS